MLFRLALALGRTVGELGAMAYSEFREWCEYYEIEPWGESRADLRAGLICSAVVNYAGKVRHENLPPAIPLDFMPYAERPVAPVIEAGDPETEGRKIDALLFGIVDDE